MGESGSPPLPWECAGIPLTIQTPIETTEARAASRVQFTWFILRAKIGVYQNRNFKANWIWRGGPEKVRICPAAAFRPPPPTNKLPPPMPVTGGPRLV